MSGWRAAICRGRQQQWTPDDSWFLIDFGFKSEGRRELVDAARV
jgi:hypothetical protein